MLYTHMLLPGMVCNTTQIKKQNSFDICCPRHCH